MRCTFSKGHSIYFQATLERGVQVFRNTGDMMTEIFESETLSMAMGLLTATLTGAYQVMLSMVFTKINSDHVFLQIPQAST